MSRYIFIYDDTCEKSEIIQDVIGDKGFGEIVIKKKKLESILLDKIQEMDFDLTWKRISSSYQFNELESKLDMEEDCKIIHWFSNFVFGNDSQVKLSFEKLKYTRDVDYRLVEDNKKTIGIIFHNAASYVKYLKNGRNESSVNFSDSIAINGVIDIGVISNFIHCITGNFDSRYFNSMQGDDFTVVKSSTNKKKIKSEYMYYHLLPDDMKWWYVMPFNYQEKEDTASYTMERLHMTDLAVRWVHGSIDIREFERLLDKYFYYFSCQHKKQVDEKTYKAVADKLYIEKVVNRISDLKKLPEYQKISKLLEITLEGGIDSIVDQYFKLKEKIENKNKYPMISVIGHGDPCFANALYNKSTQTLKFIDPKGALKEEELWTNPYYDIAKLSHSICGKYDFFNSALFDIKINGNFQCELSIEFDNSEYVDVFKRKLKENGYDYLTVRIYEASLFISMLPLHIDYPHKVFGFILNALNILKEIEKDV